MKKRKILNFVFGVIFFIAISVGLVFLVIDLINPVKDSFAVKSWQPLADRFKEYGVYAFLAIFFLQALFIVIPVIPATPLQIIAAVVLDPLPAFLILIAGIFVGNSLLFFIVRKFGPNALGMYAKKDSGKMKDIENIEDGAVLSKKVILLYFVPVVSYGLIAYTCAKSKMSYFKYILLTTLGTIPSLVISLLFGNLVVNPVMFVIILASLIVLSLIMLIFSKNISALFKKKPKKDMNYFQNNVRKPSKFLYFVFYHIVFKIFRGKVNLKVENAEIVKSVQGPFILLFNHGSFFDWVYAFPPLYPKKPNVLMAYYYFTNYRLGKYIHKAGGIPKFLYQPDISAIKSVKKVIELGGSIAIAPEGRLSAYGEIETIAPATEKLLKRLKVPVYLSKIEGGYLTKPKWAKTIRKGRVDLTYEQVFTSEELEKESASEIKSKLEERLYYNDFAWQKENKVYFKGKKFAEGLENILYLCPACQSEFSLKTKDNKIMCTHCALEATLNNYYEFESSNSVVPLNIREWFLRQKAYENECVAANDYELSEKVTLKMPDPKGKGFAIFGTGLCRFTSEGLSYEGTINGEVVHKFFEIEHIPVIPFGANENFEVYHDLTLYYFAPEVAAHAVKWSVVGEALYKKHLRGINEHE